MRRTSAVLIGSCLAITLVVQGCATTPPEPQKASAKPAAKTVTGPPVTATGMTPSGTVAFTASVVYKDTKDKGPTWVYTVATATGSPITGVDIISPHNLKDCTLKAPETLNGSTTSNADTSNADTSVVDWKIKSTTTGNPVGFTDHGGAPSVTFTITCKQQNGPTYLLVTDHAGTMTEVSTASGQSILGPIAGPN